MWFYGLRKIIFGRCLLLLTRTTWGVKFVALFNFSLYLSMPRGILHIHTNELSSFGLTTHLLVFTSRKTSNRLIISPLEITDESIIGTHHSIQRVWKTKLLLKFYFLCSSISICFLNCLQFRKVKGEQIRTISEKLLFTSLSL